MIDHPTFSRSQRSHHTRSANMPYGIWMTKNFMDAVPVSLEEAARVDGANSIQVLKNVIIPLMKPGILTVLIYVFTGAWGNFFTPFILLQSTQKYPFLMNWKLSYAFAVFKEGST